MERAAEGIIELLRQMADTRRLELPADTESLFASGVLDSFGLLEFIGALEEKLNIRVPDEDLVPANFETIARIRSYVSARRQE